MRDYVTRDKCQLSRAPPTTHESMLPPLLLLLLPPLADVQTQLAGETTHRTQPSRRVFNNTLIGGD